MIDTKKIREENHFTFSACDGSRVSNEICRRGKLIKELCDEVNRITKSHEVAHNLYVAAWDRISELERELDCLVKGNAKKDKRIDILLDILLLKRESS